MSKKRKYRAHPVKLNACIAALERNRILKESVTGEFSDELEIAALTALDTVTRGHGTKDQWDVLANALNHGWLMAKAGIGAEARDTFNEAHEAMRRMIPHFDATGQVAFASEADQKVVEEALSLWGQQLRMAKIGEIDMVTRIVEREYWKHREVA